MVALLRSSRLEAWLAQTTNKPTGRGNRASAAFNLYYRREKMFISKFYMPLTDDSDKPLVKIAKFALIVAANVVLDRLGGPRLPNNTRF